MKKTIIAILALVSFGLASSAHAFFDPINTPVTAIFGGPVPGITAPMRKVDDQPVECAHVKDQKRNQTKKQVKSMSENALTSPLQVPIVDGKLLKFN